MIMLQLYVTGTKKRSIRNILSMHHDAATDNENMKVDYTCEQR